MKRARVKIGAAAAAVDTVAAAAVVMAVAAAEAAAGTAAEAAAGIAAEAATIGNHNLRPALASPLAYKKFINRPLIGGGFLCTLIQFTVKPFQRRLLLEDLPALSYANLRL